MFAINLALAAFLGYLVDGPFGIGAAMLLAVVFMGALACLRDPATWFAALWSALLVITLPLAVCSGLIAVVFTKIVALAGVARLGLNVAPAARTPFGRGIRLIQSFVGPKILTWTLANVLLLLFVGGAMGGIELALYLAPLALPVALVSWAILAKAPDGPVL